MFRQYDHFALHDDKSESESPDIVITHHSSPEEEEVHFEEEVEAHEESETNTEIINEEEDTHTTEHEIEDIEENEEHHIKDIEEEEDVKDIIDEEEHKKKSNTLLHIFIVLLCVLILGAIIYQFLIRPAIKRNSTSSLLVNTLSS